MWPGDPQNKVTFTAVLTVGLDANININIRGAKVGVKLNNGSLDVIGIRDNKFVFMDNKQRGAGINIGFAGIEKETTVTRTPLKNEIGIKETKSEELSISLGFKENDFITISERELKVNQPLNQEFEVTEEKVVAEKGFGVEFATGAGFELNISVQEELNSNKMDEDIQKDQLEERKKEK
jgi:hypothetical protein